MSLLEKKFFVIISISVLFFSYQMKAQEDKSIKLISFDGRAFYVPRKAAILSKFIKNYIESKETQEIIIEEAHSSVLEKIIRIVTIVSDHISQQEEGKITNKENFIIGDGITVSKKYFLTGTIEKFLDPELACLDAFQVYGIIKVSTALSLHWLSNKAVSVWIDKYLTRKQITIANLDEEKFIKDISPLFPEQLHSLLKHIQLKKLDKKELTIADLAFKEQLSLEDLKLNLCNKNLTSIDSFHYIKGFKKLLNNVKKIDLSKNYLTSFPDNFLKTSKKLNYLKLKGNYLKIFKESTVSHCSKLKKINLAHNKLKKIPSFCNFNLDELNISNNCLEGIVSFDDCSASKINLANNKDLLFVYEIGKRTINLTNTQAQKSLFYGNKIIKYTNRAIRVALVCSMINLLFVLGKTIL